MIGNLSAEWCSNDYDTVSATSSGKPIDPGSLGFVLCVRVHPPRVKTLSSTGWTRVVGYTIGRTGEGNGRTVPSLLPAWKDSDSGAKKEGSEMADSRMTEFGRDLMATSEEDRIRLTFDDCISCSTEPWLGLKWPWCCSRMRRSDVERDLVRTLLFRRMVFSPSMRWRARCRASFSAWSCLSSSSVSASLIRSTETILFAWCYENINRQCYYRRHTSSNKACDKDSSSASKFVLSLSAAFRAERSFSSSEPSSSNSLEICGGTKATPGDGMVCGDIVALNGVDGRWELDELDANRNLKNRFTWAALTSTLPGDATWLEIWGELTGELGKLSLDPVPGAGDCRHSSRLGLSPETLLSLPLRLRQPKSRELAELSCFKASSSISLFAITSARFDLATLSWTSRSAPFLCASVSTDNYLKTPTFYNDQSKTCIQREKIIILYQLSDSLHNHFQC